MGKFLQVIALSYKLNNGIGLAVFPDKDRNCIVPGFAK